MYQLLELACPSVRRHEARSQEAHANIFDIQNTLLRQKPPQFVEPIGVNKILDGEAEWHMSQNLQLMNKKWTSRNYR